MMVSAMWHGFYPIYYIMFFMFTLLIEIYRDFSYHITPKLSSIIKPGGVIEFILGQIIIKTFVSFFLISHFALEIKLAWKIAENVYFLPYICIFTIFVLFKLFGK